MALPKRRHSNSRTRKRRAHDALPLPTFAKCSHCHEMKPPHRVCPHCGYYGGREVIAKGEA